MYVSSQTRGSASNIAGESFTPSKLGDALTWARQCDADHDFLSAKQARLQDEGLSIVDGP